MKKIGPLLLLGTIIVGGFLFSSRKKLPVVKKIATVTPTLKQAVAVNEKKSLFVPDWSLTGTGKIPTGYDRLIYFGTMTKSLPSQLNGQKEIWYTVKIAELPEQSQWPGLVQSNIDIAKNYNVSGIVLDLEISGLPTDDAMTQINKFVEYFYTQFHQHYIKMAVAIYGDTFYRRRPFDLRFINDHSDEIMVMAYDFHKSRGEPGPNFPLKDTDSRGYDFQRMITDFLQFVPSNKITVIFGMFGYDWNVDEKKRPIAPAKALTLNEIKSKFLGIGNSGNISIGCLLKDCIYKRDDVSKESEIDYTVSSSTPDDQGIYRIDYHIIWFEDEESVKLKTQYLNEKGIRSVAYWANGYF